MAGSNGNKANLSPAEAEAGLSLAKVRNVRTIGMSWKLGNISEIGIRGKIRENGETRI